MIEYQLSIYGGLLNVVECKSNRTNTCINQCRIVILWQIGNKISKNAYKFLNPFLEKKPPSNQYFISFTIVLDERNPGVYRGFFYASWHNSISTLLVSFGCRKQINLPSAPGLGSLFSSVKPSPSKRLISFLMSATSKAR